MSTDVVQLVTGTTTNFYQCADNANHWSLIQTAGVNSQTVGYTPVLADSGKMIVMNGSSLTLTLPNPPLAPNWSISITNLNGTALTISRNGLLIDGVSSNLSLATNLGVTILTDGTNYFSQRGIGGASPFPITTAQQVQTGGSLAPNGIGQNIAAQIWSTVGAPTPVILTTAQTGGSLISGHAGAWRITFNSVAGQTLPGGELAPNVAYNALGGSCASGSACTVTITAPSLPSGYTSYTVYGVDCTGTPCSGGETTVTGCVAITGNCVETAIPAGSSLPTTNTAFLQPSPLGTSTCSPATTPFWFISDGTNFYPYAGIDNVNTASIPVAPYNKLSFCRPVWFNDESTVDPPYGKKGFVMIHHLQNGVTTELTQQDSSLQINSSNCSPIGQACSDSATHYGLEGIQVEQDISGTPTINGSPDGEVTAGSFQTAIYATSSYASNAYGTNGIRDQLFRQSGAAVDSNGLNGLNVIFSNNSTVSGASIFADAINATCVGVASATAIGCALIQTTPPQSTAFPTGYYVLFNKFNTNYAASGNDEFIRNDVPGMDSVLGGRVFSTTWGPSNVVPVATIGDININGSVTTLQQTTSVGSSPSCSGGASQYQYKWVAIDTNGGAVASSTTMSTASTCVNPLTGGNPVTVPNPGFPASTTGAFVRLDLYRTSGPMGTGKIGCLGATGSGCTWIAPSGVYNPTLGLTHGSFPTISDTGLVADGGSTPTVNTTGGIGTPANAVSHLVGNLFQVGSSGFTTANNTNLQTITGLVFNLSQVAANYSFHCSLSWSQATGNAAVAFGIQTATAAATNVFANGTEQITVGPPATSVTGTLATLASTVATSIVSGTPTATATNYVTYLDGTIEEPVNDAGQVVNIMVSTATGTDPVTVLRGSYCALY